MIKKYNSLSKSVKASFWFTVCNVLQKGTVLLTVPVFTRIMTTEEYGVTSVYQSWYGLMTIFVTLNLVGGVFNNGMMKFQDKRYQFMSALQGLTTVMALLWTVLFLLGHVWFEHMTGLPFSLLLFMFLSFVLAPSFDFWSAKQRYEYQYKKLILLTALHTVLSVGISIFCVMAAKDKASAKIISSGVVLLVISLVLYCYIFLKGRCFCHRLYWKYVLRFNIPLIPHYLSTMILNQSDRIMISRYCGMQEAGFYNVAHQIAFGLSLLTNAINASLIPYVYDNMQNKKYGKISKYSYSMLWGVGGAALILILIAPELMKVYASKDYYEAVWIIPPLVLAVFFQFLFMVFVCIEFYYEKNIFITVASVVGAIANVILNAIFIPRFGYAASAYTTLFCFVLFSACHYAFMVRICRQKLGKKSLYHLGKIIRIASCISVLSFAAMGLYEHALIRYLVFAVAAIALFGKPKLLIQKLGIKEWSE